MREPCLALPCRIQKHLDLKIFQCVLSRSDHFKECQFLGFTQFNIHLINIKQIFISFYGRHWLSWDNSAPQFVSRSKSLEKSERQQTDETETKQREWWWCEAAQAEDGDRDGVWWWGSPPSLHLSLSLRPAVWWSGSSSLSFSSLQVGNIHQYIFTNINREGKKGRSQKWKT